MKKILIILLLILSVNQVRTQSSAASELLIPYERIYLHQNTTFLMSGEYLYYKVYCVNNETGKASDLSKMAYVQLVGKDGNTVFSHKIRLEDGAGKGDFFMPTSVPSGNYKLVAFTHWMRNGSVEHFYQNDLVVINPFQNNQNGLMRSASDSARSAATPKDLRKMSMSSDIGIEIQLTPQQAGAREKATITIANIPEAWHGNYSLSVRKVFDLPLPERETAVSFEKGGQNVQKAIRVKQNGSSYLPELRGELLTGSVISNETGEPVTNRKVALSIPGTNYLFKISNTGADGAFFFNLDEPYSNEQALIQVIGDDRDAFRIEMDPFESPDYSGMNFSDFVLSEEMEEMILAHSVENQVQNAYAQTRVDSISRTDDFPPFFSKPTHEYYLDDFTRFPTIKETILEVIEQASTRQRKGEQFIHVRVYDDDVESGLSSLLLIDGLFIQDHNTVVEAKASKIRKISVINEQYLYGSEVFEGIISMESYEGDFLESLPQLKGQKTRLFRPELVKEYHKQDYRYKDRYKRIPDFRTQLLWEPEFQMTEATESDSFYTSDLSGTYEIVLEGFNEKGKALSLRKVFKVN